MQSNKFAEPPKFLGKGTYGCTFYPSINACNGQQEDDIDSDHYITKIQKNEPAIEDEIYIGKRIQQLELYDHYFAPIVKYCSINTVNMDYNLVKTCYQIQNEFGELESSKKYIANKIRYVGKYNIVQYLTRMKKTPIQMYRKLLNTHLYLLDGLEKLLQENIIHFDLKPQNIMYDDIQNIPIIIDFGISKDITPITHTRFDVSKNDGIYRKIFISDESYGYWCIDIFILSNIGNISFLRPNNDVTLAKVAQLLQRFITHFLKNLITSEEITKFKQQMLQYFKPYIEKQQTWSHVFRDLVQHHPTWDNYSLAVSYLVATLKCSISGYDTSSQDSHRIPSRFYRSVVFINLGEPYNETIQSYISILKQIVLSTPDKRPTIDETRQNIVRMLV